jgi:SAM-dependent methyltransferase
VIVHGRRAAAFGWRATSELASGRKASFVTDAPDAQSAVDAVPVKWASRLPEPFGHVQAGEAELFDDPRVHWAFGRLGGVQGKTVLDLGPLEGGHSYMAHQGGASRVVGVEANRMAFLKCLVVKELLQLSRCSFLCGDVTGYLQETTDSFDVCIACGILYHMVNPLELLALISERALRLVMWTHVYSASAEKNKQLSSRMSGPHTLSHRGVSVQVRRHSYGLDNRLSGFFGGVASHSHWIEREDLFRALDHFGWRDVEVAFDEPDHQNGPALALVAVRR